jgi:hypothetical protein
MSEKAEKGTRAKRPDRPYARAAMKTLNGWKAMILENETLAVTVLPEYGGWIYSVFYKPRAVELLWQCPRGLCRRNDPPVITDPLFAYRARTLGAWPEIFPHGSSPTEACGTTLPMHGETALRAWDFQSPIRSKRTAVGRMRVECHLMPLRLERTLKVTAGLPVFTLEETVTNYSGAPVDFMWGHHPLFGKPLLSEQARISSPAGHWLAEPTAAPTPWPRQGDLDKRVCPREGAGTAEMFYLDALAAGWTALTNPVANLGVALSWDTAVFPYVWIWREANSSQGYPYFGRAYAVAIEPFSSLPGARERGGRLLHLEPYATLTTRLNLTAFQGLSEVTDVSPEGVVSGESEQEGEQVSPHT